MKATRLGTSDVAVPQPTAAPPASFFSKLSAIHYAGAGLVLLLVMGAVIAIPVFLLGGKSDASNTETKTNSPAQKPDVVTMPQQQQQPQQQSQTSSQNTSPQTTPDSNSANQAGQSGDLMPIDSKAKDDKTAPKPAAPKKETPAAKPKSDSKSRAEKLLTGN